MPRFPFVPSGLRASASTSLSALAAIALLCLSGCGSGGSNNGGGGGSNPISAPVAGSVIFSTPRGNVAGPSVSLSINATPAQTATTDANGNFTFAAVPYGTYTITPSLSGTNAIFTPATQSVTVGSGGAVTSFKAAVGYSVSGTVSYTGTATGPIYLALEQSCDGCPTGALQGTSIPAPGPFTINGAAPGPYIVEAWRDTLNNGAPNESDPTGSSATFTVSSADLTGVSVALTDPAPVDFTSAHSNPYILPGTPINQGVVLEAIALPAEYGIYNLAFFNFLGVTPELATSYTLQWSTDPTFSTVTGSKSYPATGGQGVVWILNGLTNGQILYFRYQGVAGSATSQWSKVVGPTTIGEPTGSVTVSGNVTFANAATGPLYVSFGSFSGLGTRYAVIPNPVSPQPYSIQLPADDNYQFSAFIDQNNDNVEDSGDMLSVVSVNNIAITGSTATQNLTLQGGGNSFVEWQTGNFQDVGAYWGTTQGYFFNVFGWDGSKHLVAAKLLSGPNVVVPQDVYRCFGFGIPALDLCTDFNLNGNTPKAGDAYGLQLTYSDGSQETVTGTVTSVPGSFGANPSPAGVGTNLTPNFSWTDPANASSYGYTFYLSGTNVTWTIPGSGWGTFSSSIDSLTWGVDPTGGGNLPIQSSMGNGMDYEWQLAATDSNNNLSELTVGYYPGYTGVVLPAANPSTLGAATVGQSYTGTIVASGGNSSSTFTVAGLSDGLSYTSNGGTLTISGTPIAAGTITFQVTVQSDPFHSWGPVTYTINVGN